VTGFYANSRNYITADREIGILPQDAHVWLEVNVGRYWIPLEPTPGFDGERLSVGLWYRIKEAKYMIGFAVVAIPNFMTLLYLLRGVLLEVLCAVAWPLVAMASDRGRVVWLARLLDLRSRLAGIPRQKCRALRSHLSCANLALPTEYFPALY
jgi:protein-glutamine gamma-glutamyltransferase